MSFSYAPVAVSPRSDNAMVTSTTAKRLVSQPKVGCDSSLPWVSCHNSECINPERVAQHTHGASPNERRKQSGWQDCQKGKSIFADPLIFGTEVRASSLIYAPMADKDSMNTSIISTSPDVISGKSGVHRVDVVPCER